MPDESDGETSLALAGIAKAGSSVPDAEAIPEFVVYDDIPGLIDQPETAPPPTPVKTPASLGRAPVESTDCKSPPLPASPSRRPATPAAPAQRLPAAATSGEKPMLLVSRQLLYFQAALIAAVAGLAFLAGYWSGYGDSHPVDPAAAGDALDPVVVEGKLVYGSSSGTVRGDAGAVIVALPVGASPPTPINTHGLRPNDAEPDAVHPGVAAIGRLGGAYLWADDDGAFSLVVPRPGRYYVLLVSRQTGRPTSQPVDRNDLAMLAPYFARPRDILGSRKYRLDQWILDGETRPISHDFGRHLR